MKKGQMSMEIAILIIGALVCACIGGYHFTTNVANSESDTGNSASSVCEGLNPENSGTTSKLSTIMDGELASENSDENSDVQIPYYIGTPKYVWAKINLTEGLNTIEISKNGNSAKSWENTFGSNLLVYYTPSNSEYIEISPRNWQITTTNEIINGELLWTSSFNISPIEGFTSRGTIFVDWYVANSSANAEYANAIGSWYILPRAFLFSLTQGTNSAYTYHHYPFLCINDESSYNDYYYKTIVSQDYHKTLIDITNSGTYMYIDYSNLPKITRGTVNCQIQNISFSKTSTYSYVDKLKDVRIYSSTTENDRINLFANYTISKEIINEETIRYTFESDQAYVDQQIKLDVSEFNFENTDEMLSVFQI